MLVPVEVTVSEKGDKRVYICTYPHGVKSSAMTTKLKNEAQRILEADPPDTDAEHFTLYIEADESPGSFEISL
jgi:hypothetical protein